jgi:hypothetical protein
MRMELCAGHLLCTARINTHGAVQIKQLEWLGHPPSKPKCPFTEKAKLLANHAQE